MTKAGKNWGTKEMLGHKQSLDFHVSFLLSLQVG